MKDKLLIVLGVICVLISSLFFYFSYKWSSRNKMLEHRIEKQEEHVYSMLINQLESSLIQRQITVVDSFKKGKFILFFPNDVCDVCNRWLFEQIKNCEDSTRMLAIVPPRMKKTVSVYDRIYELHLHDVIYTDDYLLEVNTEGLFYIFYFSERGEILYPCFLKNNLLDLKSYIDVADVLNGQMDK